MLCQLVRHNKVWFNEGDYRTHTVYGTGHVGEPPADPAGSIEVLRREMARATLKHYQCYLMDFGWNWFYDRDVLHEVGALDRVNQFMLDAGTQRNAEVAAVADQESQLYYNYYANPNQMRMHCLDRIGADYEFYELRRLSGCRHVQEVQISDLSQRVRLSDRERAAIEKIKNDGRTVLWMHDPGRINLSRRAADVAADLTAYRPAHGDRPTTERPHLACLDELPEVYRPLRSCD